MAIEYPRHPNYVVVDQTSERDTRWHEGTLCYVRSNNNFYVLEAGSWVNLASGGTPGTVTDCSVVSANGFAGTVANASTTPAITLTTSITGVLKGNGTAISAAVAGTDYLAPSAIGVTVQAYDADLTSWAGVTRASGFDTFTATPSSANLRSLITDETGSGALVFANTPTLVTPDIGAATGTSLQTTGNIVSTGGKIQGTTSGSSFANTSVRAFNSGWGFGHDDGTRQLATYTDGTGAWIGTYSNHDLLIFTNNGSYQAQFGTDGWFSIPRDNKGIIFGAGYDCSISYDGTDMILSTSDVGTGVLKIASTNMWTANGTATVTISNVAPAGVGTATISKWLTVKDDAGVVYYIPAWT